MVVDDEKAIADLVEVYLKNENFHVFKCYSGEAALSCIESQKLDLAILDLMLPDVDGISICRRIREKYTFPVIMLTAKVEDMDKITGLSVGADDYMTKPFHPLEMLARVKAQLRRYLRYNEGMKPVNRYDCGGLVVNRDTRECSLYGREISLTPTEFDILWLLCVNNGKVVSTEDLFETVWGEKFYESNNTVMVHIRRLREKLDEPPRQPKFIKTVWGVGYKIGKEKE